MKMQLAVELDDAGRDEFHRWVEAVAAAVNPGQPRLTPGQAVRALIRAAARQPGSDSRGHRPAEDEGYELSDLSEGSGRSSRQPACQGSVLWISLWMISSGSPVVPGVGETTVLWTGLSARSRCWTAGWCHVLWTTCGTGERGVPVGPAEAWRGRRTRVPPPRCPGPPPSVHQRRLGLPQPGHEAVTRPRQVGGYRAPACILPRLL